MSETPIPDAVWTALREALDRAYAPYSGHPVAALVVGESGRLYGGCNVEVAHYKSLCAEAGAIAGMVAAGERAIRSVYVLGPGETPCTPCGDCRQRIREFASPQTRIVVLGGARQVLRHYDMETLLPDSFGPEHLDRNSPMQARRSA